jgi:phage terminase large subunit-like protein
MLSNTATPKYYGQFRDAVIRGEIPVNEEVSMYMNIIDRRIANPQYYYDDLAVESYIDFCESELTLRDGSDFFMLDSFKLWAEDIFGWYYFIERSVWNPSTHSYELKIIRKRLINIQYLIVGRGASKTGYGSTIQGYFVAADTSTTQQCVTAPTERQGNETFSYLKTAITRSRGPLFKFLTHGSINNTTGSSVNKVKLASTKKGIQNFVTNSIIEFCPMDIDRLQGRGDKVATIDEWLSCDIRESPIEALEQGCAKNDDYLILAYSSEGTVRNGIGDTIKMELMDILKGNYRNDHVSIWWYKLDSLDEVGIPAMWPKANPNIGKTVSYETYQQDVEKAEHNPVARNDILAKRFGIPMEGYTYFFTYEETLPTANSQSFWGMPCSLGVDLSQGGDFCAFTFLFPLSDGSFGVKTLNFISEYTMSKLQLAMRTKYDEFVEEGSLIVMNGTVLDMQIVYEFLERHIDSNQYDVCCLGYDPYNAKEFIMRWTQEHTEWGVEKVIQGKKTESVPLTEIKKLAEQRLLRFDEKLMTYTMGNCIVVEDVNGNKQLLKKTYEAKIDAVAALLDAFVAYKLNKESFA